MRQTTTTTAATEAMEAIVSRYGELSGDRAAFADSLHRPVTPCVWAHPLKLTRDRLAELLEQEHISSQPVAWCETALRLARDSRPGLTWLYRAGLMQTQDEAAMLPVRLLDPRPGERILDLCATPGNKTAQIALALANQGTVVANDKSKGRLAPLHTTISRLGLMNVTSTAHDGTTYPAADATFDKVLVDVPCSGEGTVRKGAGKHKPVPDDFRRWLTGIQFALLNRATDLCRPGGRIVYSTCTIAPDENEAIIDRVLTERPDDLRVVATTVPGLRTSPGLSHWRDRHYNDATEGSIRLWPHLADTSGFFAVLLERTAGPNKEGRPVARSEWSDALGCRLDGFTERFGLPRSLAETFRLNGKGNQLRLIAYDHDPPAHLPVLATGLAFTRDKAKQPKLSTQAALAIGGLATRNVIELTRTEVDVYLARGSLSISEDRLAACSGPGYVIVRHLGFALGMGTLRDDPDRWILDSLFPKRWG